MSQAGHHLQRVARFVEGLAEVGEQLLDALLVHRWRSTSRSQPRAAASRASVSCDLTPARSRGAYSAS